MNSEKIEKLKGLIITNIRVTNNESTLIFDTNEGEIEFSAEGDCCSDSWIEHFENMDSPQVIIDFKEVKIPPSFSPEETKLGDHSEDVMEYHFYDLVTDKGNHLIEMRNSSNGYYGGWLE